MRTRSTAFLFGRFFSPLLILVLSVGSPSAYALRPLNAGMEERPSVNEELRQRLLSPTPRIAAGAEEGPSVEESFVNRQRAAIQRLWFEKRILPADHPSAAILRNQLKRIVRTVEPELFVVEDEEENAFATGTDQIYVTTGMLRMLESEEELLALLMHELTHVERKDPFSLRNLDPFDLYGLGLRRLAEFHADTAMLLELDKRGINSIGAIHLTKKLAALIEEKRHDPKYYEALGKLEDWDPVHGSAAQRHMNMRELIRFVDLRHLSDETHAMDPKQLKLGRAQAKKLTSKQIEKLPDLKPDDFWRSFGRLVQDTPRATWGAAVRDFVRNQGVELTADTEKALFLMIHFQMLKSKEPFPMSEEGQVKSVSREEAYRYFAPRIMVGLLEENLFGKIGLWLTPRDLQSMGEESFKNALKDKPINQFEAEAPVFTRLREQAVDAHQRNYGHSIDFVPRWDASLLSVFLVEHAVKGEAQPVLGGVWVPGKAGSDVPAKQVVFQEEIPLHQIKKETLDKFLAMNGIGLVESDIVLRSIHTALATSKLFDKVEVEEKDGKKVLREIVYSVQDQQIIRFQGTLRSLLNPMISNAAPSILNKRSNLLQALDNAIILSGVVGRIYATEAEEEEEEGKRKEHLPFIEEIINERPMNDAVRLFRSVAKKIDGFNSTRFNTEARDWYASLANEPDRGPRFYDIMDLLLLYLEHQHDWEDRLRKDELDDSYLTNEEIRKIILLELYTSRGSQQRFLRGVNQLIGTNNAEILRQPGSFIKFLKETIRQANAMGLGSQWTFDVRDKGRLSSLLIQIKHKTLERMSRSSPRAIFQMAVQLAGQWGIAFVNMPRSAYEEHWTKISKKLNADLKQRPDFPSTAQDFERVLAISLLSQESFSAMSLSAVSFRELIRRSKSFDEAFSYLKKYGFLPRTILREGIFTLVEEKANSHEELQALSEWFMAEIDRLLQAGGDVMSAEIAQAMLRFIPEGEHLEFFKGLISTNETDEVFKRYMAQRWWRAFNSPALEFSNYRDIALLAYYGEEQGNLDKIAQAKGMTAEYLHEIDFRGMNLLFFDEFYPALFRLDSVVIYLLLRSLTLEGREAIFRSNPAKADLINHFIGHYLKLEKGEAADRVVKNITDTLVNDLDPEDLFYFLGPALSQVALQVPAEPYSTERIVDLLLERSLGNLKKDFPGIEDEQKHPVTRGLLRTRLKAFVKGITPSAQVTRGGEDLRVFFPENVPYMNFEDAASEKLAHLMPERKVFGKQVTPMELGVEVSKHVGGLAVRMLQLVGMYFELSQIDREAISEVYDVVRGQTKLQAYLVMKREAEDNPKFKALFDKVVEFGEMAGGGSIVTVYRAVDENQDAWALGVKNPNAAYRSAEFLQFAHRILDGLIRRGKDQNAPELKYYQLLKLILSDAHQWVLNEISDPAYLAKNKRFAEQNDYRSPSPDRFKAADGLRHKLFIPEIKETDTDGVRWEKFVQGASFNDFLTELGRSKEMDSKTRLIAKDSVAVITQNYFFQLLETGVVHSDIHPGQFLRMPGERLAVLDRKNILSFENDGKELLLEVIADSLLGHQDRAFDKIAAHFITDDRRADPAFMAHLRELVIASFDPSSPEISISSVFFNLKQQNVEIPLKWVLVTKNLIALNKMAQLAGFPSVLGALIYSPEAEQASPDIRQIASKITKLFPKSSQKLITRVGQEWLTGNLGALLEKARVNPVVSAGLEEGVVDQLAEVAGLNKGVMVITRSGFEEHPELMKLARHPEFSKRMIVFSAVMKAAQLAQLREFGVRVIDKNDFDGLVIALLSMEKADRVSVLEEAGTLTHALAKALPPSILVIHLAIGARIKAILSAFIPEEQLDQLDPEVLGTLARLSAA